MQQIDAALAKRLPDYQLIRDIIEGDRTLKERGELYFTKLSGQDANEYKAYISRPAFENYTARVLDGLVGLAFAKDPIATLPASMDMIVKDVTLADESLDDLATDLVREVLTVGRCGMLIDMPKLVGEGLTKADIERMNIRPYSKIYKSESILKYRYELINNIQTLTMVRLEEVEEVWVSDLESKTEIINRVLILRDGVYYQQIWRENDKKEMSPTDESYIPMMNGKPLDFIPFIGVTVDKLSLNVAKPPMLDLANVNLSHFKLLIDFYNGAHYTALPTAFIWGAMLQEGETIKLGSTAAHVFADPSGKAEYLEFKGDGLSTLSNEKDVLVNRMASLGARFLADDKKVAETSDSQQTRSSGERAILISAVNTISAGVERMLTIMAQWMGLSGEITYTLNTDYNLTSINAQFMKELIVGRATNDITPKILYDQLVKGEIIDTTTYSFEDYLIDKEAQEAVMNITPKSDDVIA